MAIESQVATPGFLLMQPAGRFERRVAVAAIILTAVAFAVLAPYARVPLPHNPLFLPVYESAQVLCDLITAVFLLGQFNAVHWRLLLVLAGGYLFSGVMAVFHLLAFPGLFAATGLLGAGPQSAAWLYFLWHIGFPITVIVYGWPRNRLTMSEVLPADTGAAMLTAVLVAVSLACVMLLVTTFGHDLLPAIMQGHQDRPSKYVVAWITWLITLAALPVLWRHPRLTTLDLWLIVVVISWACDVAQAAVFNAGRFSMGWYAGRVYGLVASSILLMMLILQSGRLYRRLADSYASERDQRRLVEERTAELDALNETLEQRVAERTRALAASNRHLEEAREELKDIGMLSATAREQERARIARDLHDELGQLLVLMKDQLWDVEESLDSVDANFSSKVSRIRELVDITLSTAKRIAANLRPDILDILGLADALDWLVGTFRERSGIEIRLQIDPPGLSLDEPLATVVFRVIQESLINVMRHAGATKADISLRREGDIIRLRICDDGCGFDADAPRKENAFGVIGMRERVYQVSGWMRIESTPGRGTIVEVSIPLESN